MPENNTEARSPKTLQYLGAVIFKDVYFCQVLVVDIPFRHTSAARTGTGLFITARPFCSNSCHWILATAAAAQGEMQTQKSPGSGQLMQEAPWSWKILAIGCGDQEKHHDHVGFLKGHEHHSRDLRDRL